MINSVKGTFDLYPPEIEKWQKIEKEARKIFENFGYKEIRTPILEHTELFKRSIGIETDIVSKEMYTFLDKRGRSLTLRPENTAPVMRAVIEHRLYESPKYFKLYYIGPQFRYERPQKGRYRQFHQIGIENIGDSTPYAEFEGIYILKELFNVLQIGENKVHINSVGCFKCRPNYSDYLKEYLIKNYENLCPDCKSRTYKNTLRVFDCKIPSCKEIVNRGPIIKDFLCNDCLTHFESLKEHLKRYNLSFEENPSLVRGLDYYVKNVFEITSPLLGAQDALAGGGRYDGLLKSLGGIDLPSFGWALGMERVSIVIKDFKKSKKEIYLIWLGQDAYKNAIDISLMLRKNNIIVYMDGEEKSLKNSLKKADRLEVDYALILGEDEIKNNVVILKNLKSGEQQTFKEVELLEFLKK